MRGFSRWITFIVAQPHRCWAVPSRAARAFSASFRVMKATKALLEVRQRSSSVRGHMIFTLARGPYLPNSLHSISSFIWSSNDDNLQWATGQYLSILVWDTESVQGYGTFPGSTLRELSYLRADTVDVKVGGGWHHQVIV